MKRSNGCSPEPFVGFEDTSLIWVHHIGGDPIVDTGTFLGRSVGPNARLQGGGLVQDEELRPVNTKVFVLGCVVFSVPP